MPPRVSLCMIVKNEEAALPLCLGTVADLVDEIVIVDTGSADRTKAVAAQFGANVYDFPWVDDFAAARNEGLRHATGDWIFWIDADDRIDEPNRQKLRTLFAGLPDDNVAYVMTYLDVTNNSPADHVKLFRNHPQIRWQYRIHEQILPSIERMGGRVCGTDVVIHTVGYTDPGVMRRKLERNLRLLQREDAEHPDDPVILFNLGRTYLRVDRVAESVPPLQRAVAGLPAGAAFLTRTAYTLLVEAHCRLGQFPEALRVCLEGRARFPDDLELLLAEGVVRRDVGDPAGAEACLVRLLERDPNNAAAQFHLARLRPTPLTFQFNVGG
jgi:tetratricopeptide (TPR) repeat protein